MYRSHLATVQGSNMKATILPVGSPVSVATMPEEYYERGLRLIAAERRAYRKARELATNAKAWQRWERASRKLTEHENAHNPK